MWTQLGQQMKMAEMTKPLKFCARDENRFSSEEMIFDNLNWIETKKSAGCLFVLCSQMKLSDGWKRFQHLCIVKKIQCDVIFNASMLITDIIKALMSLLLPALLLQHLFNPERYCPYGALGSLKIPTLGDHLLL